MWHGINDITDFICVTAALIGAVTFTSMGVYIIMDYFFGGEGK